MSESKNVSIFVDKTAVVPPRRALDETTKRLLGANLNKRLSIRGRVFRLVINGKDAARSQDSTLQVVIVNAAEHMNRAWYNKQYDPSNPSLPDCWSDDGKFSSPKGKLRQSEQCGNCAKNIKGSNAAGTGKACRYHRRLAVIQASDIKNSDVYQLQLAATSIFGKLVSEQAMGLEAYVNFLIGNGYTISGVVTELSFDPGSDTPKLFFRPVRALTDEEYDIVQEKGASPEAISAISFDPFEVDSAGTAPTAPAEKFLREDRPLTRDATDIPEPKLTAKSKPAPVTTAVHTTPEAAVSSWIDEVDDDIPL
jgi:hypothetical protein